MNILIALLVYTLLIMPINMKSTMSTKLHSTLQSYVSGIGDSFSEIPKERKESLSELSDYVIAKRKANEEARLVFICTHNSRRSHMAQLWAQAAAYYYGIEEVKTYSGGTEATAFNPRAVASMREAGFNITTVKDGENPEYSVTYAPDAGAVTVFSKVFDHSSNPQQDFCAVMTCSDADQNCPFIPGASMRLAIPYEDPKEFDGTAKEVAGYRERCRQIATEMFYVFSLVRS
jgi:protein-tyrosine-phosphatase